MTRIMPWAVPWAAAGLMVVMISATVFHLARNELMSALITALLFLVATFEAYMRWKVMPIRSRAAA